MGHRHIPLILLILFALFCVLRFGVPIHLKTETDEPRTVSFTGTGEELLTADTAEISFTFSDLNKDVSEARSTVRDRVNDAYTMLENFKVEERDIRTTKYDIYPEYDYIYPGDGGGKRTRELRGYRVSHVTSVRIRDIDTAGDILDAVSDLKPNNIGSLQFTHDDEKKKMLEEQAELSAIGDAKEKARRVAKEAGIRLGRIVGVRFSTPNRYERYPVRAYSADVALESSFAPAPTPIAAGEDKITSTATVTYEIE